MKLIRGTNTLSEMYIASQFERQCWSPRWADMHFVNLDHRQHRLYGYYGLSRMRTYFAAGTIRDEDAAVRLKSSRTGLQYQETGRRMSPSLKRDAAQANTVSSRL